MDPGLTLGWRSTLLAAAAAQSLILAAAVMTGSVNRKAGWCLGAALIVIAGLLTPYALGFAGAYDRFRWLTFAPFAAPLALGPLLYLYARALSADLQVAALRHLLLPAAHWLYGACCFLLPMPTKWDWYVGGHRRWAAPAFDGLIPVSLVIYAAATLIALKRMQARNMQVRSDDARFAAAWLARVLVVLLACAVLEAGFWLWSISTGGIDFFQETGLYVALGLAGIYLGVEGWRHADLPAARTLGDADPIDPRPDLDWALIGADLEARTRREEWWREPDLSLARLARLCGTHTGRISRAVNVGLGVNFSTFVNGLRAEAVAEALCAGRQGDLLDLALEMGFASKASFNRAFRQRFGVSPSRYRRNVSDPDSLATCQDLRRARLPKSSS